MAVKDLYFQELFPSNYLLLLQYFSECLIPGSFGTEFCGSWGSV